MARIHFQEDTAAQFIGRRVKFWNPRCEPDRFGTVARVEVTEWYVQLIVDMDLGGTKPVTSFTDVGIGCYLLDRDEARQQAAEHIAAIDELPEGERTSWDDLVRAHLADYAAMCGEDELRALTLARKLTEAEFAYLRRNADGDVIDLGDVFYLMTPGQRSRLTGDDQARVDDLDEDLRCLLADARAEFG